MPVGGRLQITEISGGTARILRSINKIGQYIAVAGGITFVYGFGLHYGGPELATASEASLIAGSLAAVLGLGIISQTTVISYKKNNDQP